MSIQLSRAAILAAADRARTWRASPQLWFSHLGFEVESGISFSTERYLRERPLAAWRYG